MLSQIHYSYHFFVRFYSHNYLSSQRLFRFHFIFLSKGNQSCSGCKFNQYRMEGKAKYKILRYFNFSTFLLLQQSWWPYLFFSRIPSVCSSLICVSNVAYSGSLVFYLCNVGDLFWSYSSEFITSQMWLSWFWFPIHTLIKVLDRICLKNDDS